MADLTTVRAAIAAALDEADTALGQQTVTSQLAAKDAQIATLTADLDAANANLATLQTKITDALAQLDAADAADAQEDAGRAGARAKLTA